MKRINGTLVSAKKGYQPIFSDWNGLGFGASAGSGKIGVSV
ncbi:hypothetical protein [Pedobacter ginsengisoli]|nr:hypothetical protein [Pedobacter ginsengisoli]